MPTVTLRFYGSLNDFLSPAERQHDMNRSIAGRTSVKDLIESSGVPHPEVELVLVDGASVGFDFVLEGAHRVAAYPRFRQLDLGELSLVAPPPLGELRFVVDGHLGRLAAYLRALGFDTEYDRCTPDEALARSSSEQQRMLLTRDVGLLKRTLVEHGHWIRATRPEEQLAELSRTLPLAERARPFSRCVLCNAVLEPRAKGTVAARVPERSLAAYDTFCECPRCQRVYWQGTHHAELVRLFARAGALDHRDGRAAGAAERPPDHRDG